MALDTLFQSNSSSSGTSSSSGQYVQDSFLDTSRQPSNNTGLTSTALTNPLGFFLNDNDTPQYAVKRLYIKNIVLIEDRTKWISNKPTYEIVWNENCAAVKAYVVGAVRLRQQPSGTCVEIREVGDLIGVTGVVRQVAWLLNSTTQTGTCTRYTDSVAGSTLTFGSAAATSDSDGLNISTPQLHNTSLNDENIHDYRLVANEYQTLRVSGVIVYTQNAGSNIKVNPGSTYLDKSLISTGSVAGVTLPTITSSLGAVTAIQKTLLGGITLATVETPYVSTVGTGFSGTNLVSVSVGSGASFPQGLGIIAAAGTSMYVGVVTSQSSDTLTISPTLTFGLSNATVYKAWSGIPTLAISASLYTLKKSIDFTTQNNTVDSLGFNVGSSGLLSYSDPEFGNRLWGRNLAISSADNVVGLGFLGNTAAFLQVDGEFAAAEFEWMGQGIMHATLSVNGIDNWGINTGFTGPLKRTVITDAGQGWNSFVFTPGQSFIGAVLTKVNLYDRASPAGSTLGLLGYFPTAQTYVERIPSNSATVMPIGPNRRLYADSLYMTGNWVRGSSHTLAGGVGWYGATTACVLAFQYYGKNFGFIGTEGGSMVATLDGASIGYGFNTMKTVPTLGWHSVTLQWQAGATTIVSAVDLQMSQTREIVNKQNYVPLSDLKNIPSIFTTQYTPTQAKDGDIWIQKKSNAVNAQPTIWIKLFNFWNQLSIGLVSDDPNALTFVRSHGSSTSAAAGSVQDVELFNLISWQTGVASTLGAARQASTGDNTYLGNHYVIDGANTSGSVTARNNYSNKFSWISGTTRSTAKAPSRSSEFNNFLYSNNGSTDLNAVNGQTGADKWNGTAWSTPTAWAYACLGGVAFKQGSLLYVTGGLSTGGGDLTTTNTRTSADSVAAGTANPSATSTMSGSQSSIGGFISHAGATDSASTASYQWNGSAWSSSITASYSSVGNNCSATAFMPSSRLAITNGGIVSAGGAAQTQAETFNGIAFTASTASSTARANATTSAI